MHIYTHTHTWGFPGGASCKEPNCQCRRSKRCGFDPWVGKTPWRRAWQPTPVFLPGESQGQRGPAGYGPQGHKQLDTTEATQHTRMHIYTYIFKLATPFKKPFLFICSQATIYQKKWCRIFEFLYFLLCITFSV